MHQRKSASRLLRRLHLSVVAAMERKIIAVDFDGTLCEDAYPQIGAPKENVIGALLREQKAGARIILWSCRSGARLEEAVSWCKDHGILFDAVNNNLPEILILYGNVDNRKVYANEYWDDKAVPLDRITDIPVGRIDYRTINALTGNSEVYASEEMMSVFALKNTVLNAENNGKVFTVVLYSVGGILVAPELSFWCKATIEPYKRKEN